MTILIASTVGLNFDGITGVIVSYLEAMDRSGLEIYLTATISVTPQIRERLEALGCRVVDMPNRKQHPLQYFFALTRLIRRRRIQVLHAHGNSATLAIELMAGRLGGCRIRIAHAHSTRCEQVRADRLLRPLFYRLYTRAIACSTAAGNWLYPGRPFSVLKNGRDLESLAFCPEVRSAVRAEYRLGDAPVIGHVGSFVALKNHAFLLEVFCAVLQRRPDARFFAVGDGPLRPQIERQAAEMGLSGHIIFPGSTGRVPQLLQAMDAMLLPSLYEGLPLVSIEWQAAGLPCILSDTVTRECGMTDFLAFCPLDAGPEQWAERLLALMQAWPDRAQCSRQALPRLRQAGFDLTEGAQLLRAVYLGQPTP